MYLENQDFALQLLPPYAALSVVILTKAIVVFFDEFDGNLKKIVSTGGERAYQRMRGDVLSELDFAEFALAQRLHQTIRAKVGGM
jgi:acetylornithine/succinyldiaminopimelate/putrescine aminotransferase